MGLACFCERNDTRTCHPFGHKSICFVRAESRKARNREDLSDKPGVPAEIQAFLALEILDVLDFLDFPDFANVILFFFLDVLEFLGTLVTLVIF